MMDMPKRNGEPRPGTAAAIRAAAQAPAGPTQTTRRRFTTAYKQRILRELDALAASSEPGGAAALLRREGLGRSLITRWRRQRDAAEEAALGPKKRGRKPLHNSLVDELEQTRREVERLKVKLQKAEIIIDVQKKLSALLGLPTQANPEEEEESP